MLCIKYDGVVGRYKFTPYLVDLVNTGSLIIPDLKINISERFFDPGARDLLYIPYSGVTTLHVYGEHLRCLFGFDVLLSIYTLNKQQNCQYCNLLLVCHTVRDKMSCAIYQAWIQDSAVHTKNLTGKTKTQMLKTKTKAKAKSNMTQQ